MRNSAEEWHAVPGYEGRYEVSDHGRVRSMQFRGVRRDPPKVLRQRIDQKGRPCLALYRDGGDRDFHVHSLVLLAFVGPRPPRMDGCHWDGDPANNRLDNLRWDTRAANAADAIRHGTFNGDRLGERHPNHKLTAAAVRSIRAANVGPLALAERHGVSEATIRDVLTGRTWSHLPQSIAA